MNTKDKIKSLNKYMPYLMNPDGHTRPEKDKLVKVGKADGTSEKNVLAEVKKILQFNMNV